MRLGPLACVFVLTACKVPSTLGLPCSDDTHCDAGQFCDAAGTCAAGAAETSTSSPAPSTTSTTDPTTTTTVDPATSSSSSTSAASDTTTTGLACGQAIGLCNKVDILVLIDNSGSMSEEFGAFIPALAQFTDLLDTVLTGPCSYHIGVTTTEVAPDFQTPECQVRGALSKSGALLGGASCFGDDAHPPYLDESDDLAAIGCLFAVGQDYDTDEKQLDTVLAALSPELAAPGACNEGFLREDAALLVLLLTDEDDDNDSDDPSESPNRTGSEGEPTAWFDRLAAIKPPEATGVLALLADSENACDPWMPAPGLSDGEGAEYGERILTFMQHYSGMGLVDHIHAGNICSPTEELVPQIADLLGVLQAVCEDSGL